MYILVDVYEREVEIVNCYRQDDLFSAKRDLVERFNEYMESEDELVEGEEYSIDQDHMWAWINGRSANIDLVIKTY